MVEIPHQPAEFRVARVQELDLITQILDPFPELVGSFVHRPLTDRRIGSRSHGRVRGTETRP